MGSYLSKYDLVSVGWGFGRLSSVLPGHFSDSAIARAEDERPVQGGEPVGQMDGFMSMQSSPRPRVGKRQWSFLLGVCHG